jgi:multimeric flavodoxin WrbA
MAMYLKNKESVMKITILNGAPHPSNFDEYLAQLNSSLQTYGHTVTLINIREIPLRYCIGCFDCWVKTPGKCVTNDASIDIDRAVIQSDFTLWAAPLKMGFPSQLLKMAIDKHLPLIHPYMVVSHSEAHHMSRYPYSPRVGLLLEKEETTDDRDLQIVTDISCRTALNLKTRLEFSLTTETSIPELVTRITARNQAPLPLPKRLPPTAGVAIKPPTSITIFNGSPRGRKGNTPIMLDQIAKGFGRPTETYHLVRMKEADRMVEAFARAECVLLGFPLYTDTMPGVVKHFIEMLEPLASRGNNPPIGFLVQSGFPESLHSRYVERYLEKLAARLGSPYLGTIVKGNGEGTRIMPAEMTRAFFNNLQALGAGLAAKGQFDPPLLQATAKPEKYPAILGPIFQIYLRSSLAHRYFDDALKQNGAFEQRFACPFAES